MHLKLTTYYRGSDIPILPENDTFHSTALFRVYEATPGYAPILIVASMDDKPVAKLLATIRRSVRMFPPGIIKRCEIFGVGEYFRNDLDDQEIFEEMLQRLTKEALRNSFLIEFRNIPDSKFGYRAFRSCGYLSINWLRVRNSLHSVEHAEDRFSLSRIRQMKKGLESGVEVREIHNQEEVRKFARMLHRVYSWKIRRHFPSHQFFQQLVRLRVNNHDSSRIFIVLYKGKIIGGSACIYSGKDAYLWFSGGMRKTYILLYPGIIAVWKALDDAKQRGYRHLEFIDVGLPFRKHGYRDFVLRFGGKQISTRRWFRFRWKWLNRVLCWIYQ